MSDLSENIAADLQITDILLTICRVKIQETRTPSQATALWKTCILRAMSQYYILTRLFQDLYIMLTAVLHNSPKTRYEMQVIHSVRIPQIHLKNWTKFYSSFISSHCDKHVSNVSIFQNQAN